MNASQLPWPAGTLPTCDVSALESGEVMPRHEVRIMTNLPGWPRGEILVEGSPVIGLDATGALATFSRGLERHGLVAFDPSGVLRVALTADSPAWHDPAFLEFLGAATRPPITRNIGVGLLGYGAIGAEHARALRETAGLSLVAICDPDPQRAAAALAADPDARLHDSPAALMNDPDVEVVVISTPPDSHAAWAMQALDAGRHVVVEKPMALTTRECDALLARADQVQRLISVYQNRRIDPDYVAIRRHVTEGHLGEVFHVEAFVGAYGHPCNYWHSDTGVSGGALFDWGSHVIDQVLDLMPGEVEHVTGLNHKRVWHDVTNADHARMTLTFDGGREATFVYSDLAAALKPRWYILGTAGAITGEWRQASVLSRTSIGTLEEDVLAPADSPPRVLAHSPQGEITQLVARGSADHPFHADLSLRLHHGFEPRVQGRQSRRVIAMLEAAEESARLGGIPVKPS